MEHRRFDVPTSPWSWLFSGKFLIRNFSKNKSFILANLDLVTNTDLVHFPLKFNTLNFNFAKLDFTIVNNSTNVLSDLNLILN
jgi:hypothetical protein